LINFVSKIFFPPGGLKITWFVTKVKVYRIGVDVQFEDAKFIVFGSKEPCNFGFYVQTSV